jgi:hypothetical protein
MADNLLMKDSSKQNIKAIHMLQNISESSASNFKELALQRQFPDSILWTST